ncbi:MULTISPECIES: ABC transporter ATP-binding protein [Streptosporangium]|uniref:Peptide/nickel transport system ATP-binding protein n=1 Tax=Streptosporangium brasiliense TaxID=47480 RepID=A0ABT9QW03_9ACTN|nr:ABC transporter ATP-binding protein [Streptosporangium brasiliense]MDP9861159.1 peptide/nickel transport system ATP-binding protein [Streptosporangium brasiliense]
MTLLELRDVTVTYRGTAGEVPAVRGVSLDLAAGQALGVAGESGSGKSTLAMALLRLLPRDARVSGEILLDGEDVLTMKWGRLRAVRWASASVVFQGAQHALNPVRRIEDQLAEPLLVHGLATPAAARRKVAELLEQVGMPAWRARGYPHELSGGQRQRVMIAMALACSPRLIIADEPTTALDVMIQAQVLALIRSLIAEHGIGMIMISHDLSVLASMCDRLAVMYAGRVVESGPSHEVFQDARHPYSRALAAAFPTVGDPASRMAPKGLGGDPPDPRHLPTGCSFHPRCQVSLPSCASREVELWPAGGGPAPHTAACVRVLPETAGAQGEHGEEPGAHGEEPGARGAVSGRPVEEVQ